MKKCLLEECQNQTSNPKFCSISCGTKHQRRNEKKITRTRLCARESCDTEFVLEKGKYENKYCSRSCAAKVNNVSRWEGRKAKSEKRCERCGAATMVRFCSISCQMKFANESKIQAWLDSEWDATTQTGLSRTIRTYLIEQAGNRCTSTTCAVPGGFAEINPVTGRCPLEVDHLDGNCYNNARENLMVVCPNCHALTPTYRALNKGSGRAYRRAT